MKYLIAIILALSSGLSHAQQYPLKAKGENAFDPALCAKVPLIATIIDNEVLKERDGRMSVVLANLAKHFGDTNIDFKDMLMIWSSSAFSTPYYNKSGYQHEMQQMCDLLPVTDEIIMAREEDAKQSALAFDAVAANAKYAVLYYDKEGKDAMTLREASEASFRISPECKNVDFTYKRMIQMWQERGSNLNTVFDMLFDLTRKFPDVSDEFKTLVFDSMVEYVNDQEMKYNHQALMNYRCIHTLEGTVPVSIYIQLWDRVKNNDMSVRTDLSGGFSGYTK